jgi:hypothetical protein
MTTPIPSATQAGHMLNTGELAAGPSAWTGERTSTGHYIVHHQIGSESYVVLLQTLITPEQDAAFAAVTEEKPDYFAYRVFTADGADRNHDVQFLVTIGA